MQTANTDSVFRINKLRDGINTDTESCCVSLLHMFEIRIYTTLKDSQLLTENYVPYIFLHWSICFRQDYNQSIALDYNIQSITDIL
jgi:hypothetical protein